MKYREYLDYAINILEKLVNIPSPSGFTKDVLQFMKKEAEDLGYTAQIQPTGCLVVDVPAANDSEEVLCMTAHVDTLGAMVRSIKSDGFIKFTSVGGYMIQSVEGEYCKVHSRRTGKSFTGTILSSEPSVHVYDGAIKMERTEKNMEIRLDEKVFSAEDVRKLGIEAGDFVSFDPRFVHTESGFIKSRHLDDKASAAVLFAVLKYMKDAQLKPARHVKVMLTGFEELGYGASWLPEGVTKVLAVDMGCVGDDLNGDEYHVSICAKDSAGTYDYDMTNELIDLARKHQIAYAIDVFPHYGSDVAAARRSGHLITGALIGQGIHASHGMERTHEEGLYNTMTLVMAYLGII